MSNRNRRGGAVPRGNELPPTPQRKLDAPRATGFEDELKQQELEGQVLAYGSRFAIKPMVMDEMPDDPFSGIYEHDVYKAKEDGEAVEVDQDAMKRLRAAHMIEHWSELRKRQRRQILTTLAKQENIRPEDLSVEQSWGELARVGAAPRLPADVRKQDEVLVSHALEVEDDRAGVVESVSRNLIIEPPFHPAVLEQLVLSNNALCQLVNAMEVNVAGTGWEVTANDDLKMEEDVEAELGQEGEEGEEDDATARERARKEAEFQREVDRQLEALESFFEEPWPGMSFTTLRRKLRHDMEATGNAYMEVIRNLRGDIVLARHIDAKLMRLVRLDDPVIVERPIERNGEKVPVSMSVRERRFVQQVGGGAIVPRFRNSPVGGSLQAGVDPNATATELDTRALFTSQGTRIIYFKEFGASRDLDMWTGLWAQEGEQIPLNRRATEIIHLTVKKDSRTPYGLPRWINQLPSVLGSRKAEEFNLAFFQAGGVPPLLITVAGGVMSEKTKKALEREFNNQNPAQKHQAIVLEVASTGRMDRQNRVAINVERFGSERMQDAMFLKYDERCGFNVRSSFRLPPIFIGDAEAHNFATAKASYLVAEAQVFQPERDEEDETYTLKLVRNMPNGENFRFRSLPLVIDDAEVQLRTVELGLEHSLLSGDEAVRAMNSISNLDLKFDQATSDGAREERMMSRRAVAQAFAGTQVPEDQPQPGQGSEEFEEIGKADLGELNGLVALAQDLVEGFEGGIRTTAQKRRLRKNVQLFEGLDAPSQALVKRMITSFALGGDSEGLQELMGCTAQIVADNAREA